MNEQLTIEKKNRGGRRANAGRKKKFGEDTKITTFRLPISLHKELKRAIHKILVSPERIQQFINQMNMSDD